MAAHRTPEQLKPLIIKGTQHIVATGGMANFSYPKLTKQTGISAPTVYEHYKNKEDLLTSCFMDIETEISAMMAKILKKMSFRTLDAESFDKLCWILWISYWNYLMADANRTIYYRSFRNSVYYTTEVSKRHYKVFKEFNNFVQEVDKQFSLSSKCNVQILVENLINGTVTGAVNILNGIYKNDDVSVTTVYHMVFQPISALLSDKFEKDRDGSTSSDSQKNQGNTAHSDL